MPAKSKLPTSTPAPLSNAKANAPKEKQTAGNAALAKIQLLDGSILNLNIDVSFVFHCFKNNLHKKNVYLIFFKFN